MLSNKMFGLNELTSHWGEEYDKLESDMFDSFVCNTMATCSKWEIVHGAESSPTPRKNEEEHSEQYLIPAEYLSRQKESCLEQLFDTSAIQRL